MLCIFYIHRTNGSGRLMKILNKLIKTESYTKGFSVSILFSLLGKVLSFLTNIQIAAYFGSTTKTDLIFFLISMVQIAAGFFVNLNSAVFIPESMKIREQSSSLKAQNFLNT